jgi:acetyl-CoA synthetase
MERMNRHSATAWSPPADFAQNSLIARFQRAHGFATFEELRQRSIEDPEWFWPAVIEDLGLEFNRPWHTVLDQSDGIEWAKWFLGGEVNIAQNCVHRHDQKRVALIWEGEDGSVERLTYGDLSRRVTSLAAHLARLGTTKGDTVAVFLPMVPDAAVAAFACAHIGAIFVPIFSGFGADAVASRLVDSKARVLITTETFHRRGKPVPMGAVAREADRIAGTLAHTLWAPLDIPENDIAVEATSSEDPFLLAYTSGTTGRPKGAVHTQAGAIVKLSEECAYQTDLRDGDILFWLTDMGWIMGPWELVGATSRGNTVVFYDGAPDHPDPGRIWSIVERHRVTHLGVSPTLVRGLIPKGDEWVTAHDRSSLRVFGSTGEPWNPDPWWWLFEVAGETTRPIINLSGGTECCACLLSVHPVEDIVPTSLGGPSLGMACDIYDPDGRTLANGEGVGELVCTRPWPGMTRGIWGDDERYLETYWRRYPGVWTHGDWAERDELGRWFLRGRSDDTLNIAGKRLGPEEVESVLVSHPDVIEAAAVPVPDDTKGEVIWAFCRLGTQAAGDDLAHELASLVAKALGAPFRPQRIIFVADLPKTRSAKILRRAIRATVAGEDPGDLSSLENPDALATLRGAIGGS